MQSLQKARLQPLAEEYNWTMEWRDSIDNIPRDPSKFTMLVAHEFFDALPFHLLEVTARYYPGFTASVADRIVYRKLTRDGKKS